MQADWMHVVAALLNLSSPQRQSAVGDVHVDSLTADTKQVRYDVVWRVSLGLSQAEGAWAAHTAQSGSAARPS